MTVRPKRSAIMQWLEAHPTLPLCTMPAPEGLLNKAGLLPFVRAGVDRRNWRFLTMRPRGEHPELGPPPLQICKGTRMGKTGGKWRDLPKSADVSHYSEIESLPCTAMREGIEELGVMLEAMHPLYDAGPVTFTSAKSGDAKYMHLLLAEMQDEQALLPMEQVDATTAERRWVDLSGFAQVGRADHFIIIERLLALIP